MVVKTSVLKELEGEFAKSGNQLLVLYGREDSEKELLIKALVQNKKYFYYRARQVSEQEQRMQFERELTERFEVILSKHTYEECFNRVKSGDATKLVIVIDEFQYIAKKDASFIEAILKLKARRLYPGPVLVLLCSSAVAWVERELDGCIGEEAVKRLDKKIKLGSLNFLEVVRALPEYPVAECIKTYGIIGGVPGYINQWDSRQDLKTNICRLILAKNGYLYDAAEKLIGASLRELSVYETILAQIASGNDKLNDLYQATGFSRAKISVYMKNLAAFDIISKVVSFETAGWETKEFYDRYIAPGLDAYLSRYFTEVCMEYLGLLGVVGKLPLKIRKMGTWVGKEGNIDIIAQNEVRQNMVGLCNWENPELTMEMCEALFSNMKKAKISAEYYFLFSAQGFAKDVAAMAEQDKRFSLVDMNEL